MQRLQRKKRMEPGRLQVYISGDRFWSKVMQVSEAFSFSDIGNEAAARLVPPNFIPKGWDANLMPSNTYTEHFLKPGYLVYKKVRTDFGSTGITREFGPLMVGEKEIVVLYKVGGELVGDTKVPLTVVYSNDQYIPPGANYTASVHDKSVPPRGLRDDGITVILSPPGRPPLWRPEICTTEPCPTPWFNPTTIESSTALWIAGSLLAAAGIGAYIYFKKR
jgi:hypothetical protein